GGPPAFGLADRPGAEDVLVARVSPQVGRTAVELDPPTVERDGRVLGEGVGGIEVGGPADQGGLALAHVADVDLVGGAVAPREIAPVGVESDIATIARDVRVIGAAGLRMPSGSLATPLRLLSLQ